MLVDTDVFIWYMRGHEKAFRAVEQAETVHISVITYMELVQGLRNKKELNALRQALFEWDGKMLYLSEEISATAMFFMEQHFLSHSLQLPDALIGATAITYGLPLLTGNARHFKVMKNLQIKRFVP